MISSLQILLRSVIIFLTLTLPNLAQLSPEDDPTIDYYCGISWDEANAYCHLPCPTGNDTTCPDDEYGRERQCYASAGCAAREETLVWYGILSLNFGKEHVKEIMTNSQSGVFSDKVMEFVNEEMGDKMEINCMEILDQEYDRPCVLAVLPDRELMEDVTEDYYCGSSWSDASETCLFPCPSQSNDECPVDSSGQNPMSCFAATGCVNNKQASTLVLEVKICGIYIPEIESGLFTPLDLESDIMKIVITKEQAAIQAIKSSSSFFDELSGMNVIREDEVVNPPSSMPSDAPTRGKDVAITTYLDAKPSGSYGLFFSIRTHTNISSILLTGMSFLTPHTGLLEYEVYSRLGDHANYQGYNYEWDLIAKGETVGQGSKDYTPVLNGEVDDDSLGYVGFTPIHVPGNCGLRSFYITLTKKTADEKGNPIPLYFSSSLVPENDGKKVYGSVISNEELEILEGDGVLEYPAPRNRNGISDLFYRYPRGFIGQFEYTRDACHPSPNFYGWPCPYVPKTFTTVNPTNKPVSLSTDTAYASARTKSPNTEPTSSPIEFSDVTIMNGGGTFVVEDSSFADGESLVVTDKTTLTVSGNGAINAPRNSQWPAIRLSVGSVILAKSGVVKGSDVSENVDDTGGDAIHLNNGQSNKLTAGFGEFFDGIRVIGGNGRTGGDALIVNGFGTVANIYGGEFSGGSGANEDLRGYSLRIMNSATANIHGGNFLGDVKVERNGLIALHGCFSFSKAGRQTKVAGVFADESEIDINIESDGGDLDFVAVPDQECETVPSVAPTGFPTISPRPTGLQTNGSRMPASCMDVLMACLVTMLLPILF